MGERQTVQLALWGIETVMEFRGRVISNGCRPRMVHNLNVTARILLNGENDFRGTCDFKELGEAKMSHAIPFKL